MPTLPFPRAHLSQAQHLQPFCRGNPQESLSDAGNGACQGTHGGRSHSCEAMRHGRPPHMCGMRSVSHPFGYGYDGVVASGEFKVRCPQQGNFIEWRTADQWLPRNGLLYQVVHGESDRALSADLHHLSLQAVIEAGWPSHGDCVRHR